MPDHNEVISGIIPITVTDMVLASGYVMPSGRSIGPSIPITTIASGIVSYQGVSYTIYETYTIPFPTTPVPSGSMGAGYIPEYYSYPIPMAADPSGGTTNVGIASESIIHVGAEHVIPLPTDPSGVTVNNYDGQSTIDYTYSIPMATTPTYIVESETIFDFDKVLSYVGTNYLDQTIPAKNYVTNDVDLIRAGAGIGDGIMMGAYDPNWMGAVVRVTTAGTGAYTTVWEYWNGTSWSALTWATEYHTASTANFKAVEYYRIKFTSPPYWDPYIIEVAPGVFTDELYWVRCRLNLLGVTIRPLAMRIWGRRLRVRLKNARQTMNDTPGNYYMTRMPINGIIYRAGNKYYWEFKLVDYADYASPRSYIIPRVSISYGGMSFIPISNPITEISHGWYIIEISSIDIKEQMILKATGPGAAQCDMIVDIIPGTIINYYNTWGEVAVLTWGEVAIKTWRQLRINTI